MPGKYKFGVYELDCDSLELRKQGVLVRLQDQPLRVLSALVERPHEIVTREELQKRIWGKDTFVDFEQSLNKAVNRVREALNDDPGNPRYVETVPRRGYRFIAPVTPPVAKPEPSTLATLTPEPSPATAPPPAVPGRLIAILATGVLLVLCIFIFVWARRPATSKPSETTHISSSALCCSTLSRDGKLLAYASSASNGVVHIWVQQTAGGPALQITRSSEGENGPDFSPDGSRIAYLSGNGGIYIAPTLSGEPRLLTTIPSRTADEGSVSNPMFSPGGDKVLYRENDKAMTISVDGGKPVSLGLNRDFKVQSQPIWSPDGDAILFPGVKRQQPDKPTELWVAPLDGGEPKPVKLPGLERDVPVSSKVLAWVRSNKGGQWIIYSVSRGEGWKIFRVHASSQGHADMESEQLASGTTPFVGSVWGSVSEDGRLVYTIGRGTSPIFEIQISSKDQKPSTPLQLPLEDGAVYRSPSLSQDARWMAYDASIPGKPDTIVVRDLANSVDHVMDEVGRSYPGETTISPDGSKVAFERDCKSAKWWTDGTPLPCSFIKAVAGGEAEQICEACEPRGFSSNGSVILVQNYNRDGRFPHTIVAIDLTSRTGKTFLRASEGSVYHAFFSWDDRWVVFRWQRNPESSKPQIMIAPVRNGVVGKETEWMVVTDVQHADDKPQFSADGNTIYFTSDRDGYFCIWAQRLDPATKRPVGDPFPYEHFHTWAMRPRGQIIQIVQAVINLSVARDKMVINSPEYRADIWLAQIP